jgi:hypothetical protein
MNKMSVIPPLPSGDVARGRNPVRRPSFSIKFVEPGDDTTAWISIGVAPAKEITTAAVQTQCSLGVKPPSSGRNASADDSQALGATVPAFGRGRCSGILGISMHAHNLDLNVNPHFIGRSEKTLNPNIMRDATVHPLLSTNSPLMPCPSPRYHDDISRNSSGPDGPDRHHSTSIKYIGAFLVLIPCSYSTVNPNHRIPNVSPPVAVNNFQGYYPGPGYSSLWARMNMRAES